MYTYRCTFSFQLLKSKRGLETILFVIIPLSSIFLAYKLIWNFNEQNDPYKFKKLQFSGNWKYNNLESLYDIVKLLKVGQFDILLSQCWDMRCVRKIANVNEKLLNPINNSFIQDCWEVAWIQIINAEDSETVIRALKQFLRD